MFHGGDLQSGIASAIQQSKAVLCFVHDDEENSDTWENTILNDEHIAGVIRRNAVALRISAGSQEAKFLCSFCPIITVPTVVIIQNGTLKGVIPHTPSTKDQLSTRVLALFGPAQSAAGGNAVETDESAIAAAAAPLVDHVATSHLTPGPSQPEARDRILPAATPVTPNTPSTEASDHENERALARDLHEIDSASGKNPGPRATSETDVHTSTKKSSQPTHPPAKPTPQEDWTRRQRERERQQREERERIKAQIRHDHAERRQLDELRRQPAFDLTARDASNPAGSTSRPPNSSEIRIQVRTLEGSTLRSTFAKSDTITSQVRPWIDSTAQQGIPYNLKIILAPRPNRTIEAAEEEKSFEDLDIVGSCTLVMVPVKGFVESYAPSESGIIGSAVLGGYSLLSGSIGAVFGGVRSVLGIGQLTAEQQAPSAPVEVSSTTPAGRVRVRTLADQRIEAQKKDQQFYNGNQLNFVPRKDDEDEKKD